MDIKEFEKIAKALSDIRRVEIYKTIISQREISCKEITEKFPVGQSTVSHHLKTLVDSGLVKVRREGQYSFFSADINTINRYIDELKNEFAIKIKVTKPTSEKEERKWKK